MASLSKFLGFDAWWEGISMGCPPVRSALPEPTARCDAPPAGAICSQLESKPGSSSLLLLLLLLLYGVRCDLASTSCRPRLRFVQSSVWDQATTCLEFEF